MPNSKAASVMFSTFLMLGILTDCGINSEISQNTDSITRNSSTVNNINKWDISAAREAAGINAEKPVTILMYINGADLYEYAG